MGAIMLIALPASLGIAATAELIVPVLLGKSWIDAIPLFKVLAIFGAAQCLVTNSSYIFHARAQPRILTRIALLEVSFLIPTMYYMALKWGALGVAFSVLFTVILVTLPLTWHAVTTALEISIFDLLKVVWRSASASILMYLLLSVVIPTVLAPWFVSPAWLALSAISLGGVSYVVLLYLLWFFSGRPNSIEQTVPRWILNKLKPG